MKKILKGFTLAEVLITLGIIGIVAAVTLPSLQVNVNKQALSTQIAKAYSQFSEGLKMYMTNNSLDEFDYSGFDPDTFAKNYLQVQYVCTDRRDSNCFADQYTYIDSSSTLTRADLANSFITQSQKGYILRDGTIAYIDARRITFDVNNKKGPNKVGYDLHRVLINKDGSVGPSIASAFEDPATRDSEIKEDFENCKKGNSNTDYGMGCFTHLLRNNFKFDY